MNPFIIAIDHNILNSANLLLKVAVTLIVSALKTNYHGNNRKTHTHAEGEREKTERKGEKSVC